MHVTRHAAHVVQRHLIFSVEKISSFHSPQASYLLNGHSSSVSKSWKKTRVETACSAAKMPMRPVTNSPSPLLVQGVAVDIRLTTEQWRTGFYGQGPEVGLTESGLASV